MVRKFILLFFVFLFSGMMYPSIAQPGTDTTWRKGGSLGLNLNQISLSNWASGGDNVVGFNLQFNCFANYKKGRHIWNNQLELSYGLNKTKSEGSKKNNDNIYLSTLYGYELTEHLYLSGLMSFQTQFAKGYDYTTDPRTYISGFMSPGYLLAGVGLTWKPKRWFSATFTPTTFRGTFVTNKTLSEEGQFGVTSGKHLFSEFGANLQLVIQYEFLKNMTVFSRLNFYSNYLEKPQNIDINWDLQLNMAINKWFTALLSTNMIYDDNTKILQKDGTKGPRLQFKEMLAIGFQITF